MTAEELACWCGFWYGSCVSTDGPSRCARNIHVCGVDSIRKGATAKDRDENIASISTLGRPTIKEQNDYNWLAENIIE